MKTGLLSVVVFWAATMAIAAEPSDDLKAQWRQEAALPVGGHLGGVPVRLVELARQTALTAPTLPRGQPPENFSAASRTNQHDRLCLRYRNLSAKQVQPTWGIDVPRF